MHRRAITRIVGLLVILFSGTMFIPGLIALIYVTVQDGHLRKPFSLPCLSATHSGFPIVNTSMSWPREKAS
ncbi:MAG: hypothetical protein ACR5LF_15745 [Symbiopectobacterium sp.]